jgi:hypothetical protein
MGRSTVEPRLRKFTKEEIGCADSAADNAEHEAARDLDALARFALGSGSPDDAIHFEQREGNEKCVN